METKKVKELAALINKGAALTDEQIKAAKQVALAVVQKTIDGGAVTADEVAVNLWVTKHLQRAQRNAQKAAEREEQMAAKKAAHAQQMQEHALEVQKVVQGFITKFDVKGVQTAKDVKEAFNGLLGTLPKQPKMPGMGGGGTNGDWNREVNVEKLKEGSTLQVLWAAVMGSKQGLTREEMEGVMANAFKGRKPENNKFTVYEAISGRLPLVEKDGRWVVKV